MKMTETNLDASFWNDRYLNSETGWDLGEVSPAIKAYADQLTDKNIRILIPGCGNSYEAEYLYNSGFHNITVIDIAPLLVERLQQKWKDKSIKVVLGDFFEHTGEYDLILEQTFFCAIDPSLRKRYAEKMYDLLASAGRLVGILFNCAFDKPCPPFGGTEEEYEQLFSPWFAFRTFTENYKSHPKRAGRELFINLIKRKR